MHRSNKQFIKHLSVKTLLPLASLLLLNSVISAQPAQSTKNDLISQPNSDLLKDNNDTQNIELLLTDIKKNDHKLPLLFPEASGSNNNASNQSDHNKDLWEKEHLAGGEATSIVQGAFAFSNRSSNITEARQILRFNLGDDFFENPWVENRASTSLRDGLGPFFNNNACQDCHVRDGRGHAGFAEAGDTSSDFDTILIRAASTHINSQQRNNMLAGKLALVEQSDFGGQIQHKAITTLQPEAKLQVSYDYTNFEFADGEQVTMRKPLWHIQLDEKDIAEQSQFSARVAPAMIGLGLLEAIKVDDILAREDSNDSDGDGISGKANWVWSDQHQKTMLGRFGWKAGQATIVDQVAAAFIGDMGLTSRLHTQENCRNQLDCLQSTTGNGDSRYDYPYEVSDKILQAVTFYSSNLAVPVRQSAYSQQVQAGKALFSQVGCADCHTPAYQTGDHAEFAHLSEQQIFPYTDLLLHDMGEELADFDQFNQPLTSKVLSEYQATAREWRTPALWGIGRAKQVDPNASFLHDGRALTIVEAILWHGGEAKSAKQKFVELAKTKRQQILAFLQDL